MPDTLCKQPSESWLYDMDFSPRLQLAETLTGITSVTADQAGLTLGSPIFSGKTGQVRISGGTAGLTYKLTWLATTDLGNTVEAEGFLFVEDT